MPRYDRTKHDRTKEKVVSSRFPYLLIFLQFIESGTVYGEADLEALLDSGFDGEVVVPSDSTVGRPPAAYLTWTLADGSEVTAAAFLGRVWIGSLGPVDVVINVSGDEPIVGRSLTDRFRVILDHSQQVDDEP